MSDTNLLVFEKIQTKETKVNSFDTRKVFFNTKKFTALCVFLFLGQFLGAFLALFLNLYDGKTYIPMLFSGIPDPEAGIIACFSAYLLSSFIYLLILFLLGGTAFGMIAVPVFVCLKGFTIGISAAFYLSRGGFSALADCALIFTPAASMSAFIILLFAIRSLTFSNNMMKTVFSKNQKEQLDFKAYFKDFLLFLVFAVASSLSGCILFFIYSVFFV